MLPVFRPTAFGGQQLVVRNNFIVNNNTPNYLSEDVRMAAAEFMLQVTE